MSQSSSRAVSKLPVGGPPALVTRQSRPSNAAIAAATTRVTSSGRATSAAAWPAAPISAAARASSSALREQTKTRAPSRASALAQASPSPLLAPATKALQSFRPRSMGNLPGGKRSWSHAVLAWSVRGSGARDRQICVLQPARQVGLAGAGFEHDRPARERIDAIGERQRLLDQLLDQQHRGSRLAQTPHH